jgi:hypothetical protein
MGDARGRVPLMIKTGSTRTSVHHQYRFISGRADNLTGPTFYSLKIRIDLTSYDRVACSAVALNFQPSPDDRRLETRSKGFCRLWPSLEPQRIIGIMNKHGEFLYIQGDLAGFPVGIKISVIKSSRLYRVVFAHSQNTDASLGPSLGSSRERLDSNSLHWRLQISGIPVIHNASL